MIRVALLDAAGKPVLPKDVESPADLRNAVEQARNLIRECENMIQLKGPKAQGSGVPYL